MASLCLKRKKIQIPLCGIRGPLCDTRSGPSLPLQPYFSKDPLVLLILSHAKCFEILQMRWLFCAHAFAQVICCFWKVHLPKRSFPFRSLILLPNLSLKTDSVQRLPPWDLPSFLLLEFPIKQWLPKGHQPFVNHPSLPRTRPQLVFNKGLASWY